MRNVQMSKLLLTLAMAMPAIGFGADYTDVLRGNPLLSYTQPRGAGLGDTFEMTLYGSNMKNAETMLFYEEGFEVLGFREPENSKSTYTRYDGVKARWDSDRVVIAKVRIKPDCRVGEHQMRYATKGGLSTLRTFRVGAFPSVHENEGYPKGNHTFETAQTVELNRTVDGALHRFDIDAFKVELKKGQRFTAEIEGQRLGSMMAGGEADLKLQLQTATGELVAESEDSDLFLADPVIRAMVPEDGTYLLMVENQFVISDSNPRMYRLHLGHYVRPTALYPAGGPAGETVKLKVIGDVKGAWETEQRLPADVEGVYGLNVKADGHGQPVPQKFRVSQAKNLLEAEPNADVEHATHAGKVWPIALNGIIEQPGDVDVFRFSIPAQLENKVRVRVFAQSINSGLDPRMELYELVDGKPKGKKVVDDVRNTHIDVIWLENHIRDLLDPAELLSSSSKEKEYVIELSDTHGRGQEDYVYRIEIEEVKPHVLAWMPSYENQSYYQARNSVVVGRDSRYNTWMSHRTVYGFAYAEPVVFDALGLPKGVTMTSGTLRKGEDRTPVLFTASKDVKPGVYLFEVIARPEDAKAASFTSSFQQPIVFTTRNGGYGQHHTFPTKIALRVTEAAPFTVEVGPPVADLVPEGEITCAVKVTRQPGFEGPIELNMEWVPANVNRAQQMVLKPDETEAEFLVSANSKVAPGIYPVTITGRTGKGNPRNGDRLLFASSAMIPLKISEPYVKVAVKRSSVERGKTAEIVCGINVLKPFYGKAKVSLTGLPRGVNALEEFVEVSKDDKEVVLKVKATEDALYGMNRGVKTVFEFITESGDTFRQLSGYGYLRIDPERKRVVQK
jgi:hypothetical protein